MAAKNASVKPDQNLISSPGTLSSPHRRDDWSASPQYDLKKPTRKYCGANIFYFGNSSLSQPPNMWWISDNLEHPGFYGILARCLLGIKRNFLEIWHRRWMQSKRLPQHWLQWVILRFLHSSTIQMPCAAPHHRVIWWTWGSRYVFYR